MSGNWFVFGLIGLGGYAIARAAGRPATPPDPTPADVVRAVMEGPDRIAAAMLRGPLDRPVRFGRPYHAPHGVN